MPESVLYEKDPENFRTQRVLARYIDDSLALETIGAPLDFQMMRRYRESPENQRLVPEQIVQELKDGITGHAFSNVGVSIFPVMFFDGKPYTALVRQERVNAGFKDRVLKLASEYVEQDEIDNPIKAALRGISEEFYIETKDGLLVPFLYRLGKIDQPYGPEHYEEEYGIQIVACNKEVRDLYSLPGTIRKRITMNGKEIDGSPEAYVHINSNSIQLVYYMHFDIPEVLQTQGTMKSAEKHHLVARQADMHAVEEEYQNEDGKGKLLVKLDERGLVISRLDNKKVSCELYNFLRGKTEQAEQLPLSEAFAQKQDGIVSVGNISLDEYLKNPN